MPMRSFGFFVARACVASPMLRKVMPLMSLVMVETLIGISS